jgi:hypothetical protein
VTTGGRPASSPGSVRGPARHDIPAIDEAALAAARAADVLLDAASSRGIARWERYLAPIPDALRDGDLRDLRAAARTGRSAFGPKDSVLDALPAAQAIAFRDALDVLLKRIARYEAEVGPRGR